MKAIGVTSEAWNIAETPFERRCESPSTEVGMKRTDGGKRERKKRSPRAWFAHAAHVLSSEDSDRRHVCVMSQKKEKEGVGVEVGGSVFFSRLRRVSAIMSRRPDSTFLADSSTRRRIKILSSSLSVASIEVVEWKVAAFIRQLDRRQ